MKANSAAAPTRCQVRDATFGRSAMLAQTAPLTTSAATCGPAISRASSWMQPMPSAASMPLIAYAGNRRHGRKAAAQRRRRDQPSISFGSQACTFCRCSPSPSMPRRSSSPAFRYIGGFMPRPTPGGVPVVMRSPGHSVMNRLQ